MKIPAATIYLPKRPDGLEVLVKGRANGGLFRKTSRVDFELDGQRAFFTFMPSKDVPEHTRGFAGFVQSLVPDVNSQAKASAVIARLKEVEYVLLLHITRPFDLFSKFTAAMFTIAYAYDGMVLMLNSVYSGEMETLCGPVKLPQDPELLKALRAAKPRA